MMNRWVMTGLLLAFLTLPLITHPATATTGTITARGNYANCDGVGCTSLAKNIKTVDNYQLMNPVQVEVTLPAPTANPQPTSPSQETSNATTPPTTTPPKETEPITASQIIGVSASATVAAVGFILYFKKSKR
jgi:hypothetical protein